MLPYCWLTLHNHIIFVDNILSATFTEFLNSIELYLDVNVSNNEKFEHYYNNYILNNIIYFFRKT